MTTGDDEDGLHYTGEDDDLPQSGPPCSRHHPSAQCTGAAAAWTGENRADTAAAELLAATGYALLAATIGGACVETRCAAPDVCVRDLFCRLKNS